MSESNEVYDRRHVKLGAWPVFAAAGAVILALGLAVFLPESDTHRTTVGDHNDMEVSEREVVIRFDASVGEGVSLDFKPEQSSMPLHIGEKALANYISVNPSDEAFFGLATFEVMPHRASAYVSKIECFCFSQHKLDPGEEALMPVFFYIDPAIEEDEEMNDIHTITFSYTFFETAPWATETESDS